MSDGQDNDHPHLTNRHFFQNDQKRDDPSSSSHDTRPFLLSDAITNVGLTTWRPNVKCHNQGRGSMGSAEVATVVPTRERVARASQIWQDGGCDRIVDLLEPRAPVRTLEQMNDQLRNDQPSKMERGVGFHPMSARRQRAAAATITSRKC